VRTIKTPLAESRYKLVEEYDNITQTFLYHNDHLCDWKGEPAVVLRYHCSMLRESKDYQPESNEGHIHTEYHGACEPGKDRATGPAKILTWPDGRYVEEWFRMGRTGRVGPGPTFVSLWPTSTSKGGLVRYESRSELPAEILKKISAIDAATSSTPAVTSDMTSSSYPSLSSSASSPSPPLTLASQLSGLLDLKIQTRATYLVYAFVVDDCDAAVCDLILSGDLESAEFVFGQLSGRVSEESCFVHAATRGYLKCMEWVKDRNKITPTHSDYIIQTYEKRADVAQKGRPGLEHSDGFRWAGVIIETFRKSIVNGQGDVTAWILTAYPTLKTAYLVFVFALRDAIESKQTRSLDVLYSVSFISAFEVHGYLMPTILRTDHVPIAQHICTLANISKETFRKYAHALNSDISEGTYPNINAWLDDASV
jgi:hypothetical protein